MKRRGHLYQLANKATPQHNPIPAVPDAATKHANIVRARDNRSHKTGDPMPIESPYVPIATIAIEIGEDLTHLAGRLGDAVLTDSIGMRCISRDTAAAVIAEHRAQQQARQADQARRQAEHQASIAELARRNRAQRIGGRPAVSGNAFVDMMADQRYADVVGDRR